MRLLHPTAVLAVTLDGRRFVFTGHSVRHDVTVRALHRVAAAGLGRSPEGPSESPPSGGGRHAPDSDVLGTFVVLELAALLGLLDGLAADAQGCADLGPGGSVAAGCGGEEISCIRQGVLGVSHGFQGLQGPLWASLGAGESLDGSADLVAAVGAFLGGHVNGYCTELGTESGISGQLGLPESVCDTGLGISDQSRVGPPISGWCAFAWLATTEKKSPREIGVSGGLDGSGVSDADSTSLR